MRLCSQLQESCEAETAKAGAARTLLKAAESVRVDPLFLEYIAALAFERHSILPLQYLLEYMAGHASPVNETVLVYLAKVLEPSLVTTNAGGQLVAALTKYIKAAEEAAERDRELFVGLVFFVIRLKDATPFFNVVLAKCSQEARSEFSEAVGAYVEKALAYSGGGDDGDSSRRADLESLRAQAADAANGLIDGGIDVANAVGDMEIVPAPNGTAGTVGAGAELGGGGGGDGGGGGPVDDALPPPSAAAVAAAGAAATRVTNSRLFSLVWMCELVEATGGIPGGTFDKQLRVLMFCQDVMSAPPAVVIMGLITSAFDCFALCLTRKNDAQRHSQLWRSFLIKRLPVLAKQFVPAGVGGAGGDGTGNGDNTPPMSEVICGPVRTLDRGTVNLLRISGGGDELDEMFSSFPSTTSDIRHEFLQVCVDLELVTPEDVGRALGEEASAIVRNGRSKDADVHGRAGSSTLAVPGSGNSPAKTISIGDFFTSVMNERPDVTPYTQSQLTWLVSVYEELDGVRQASVAGGIVALVERCVANNNLPLVARLSQALGARPAVLDQLFLHVSPLRLLNPLIAMLDNWTDGAGGDDAENDLQGVNTTFGSVLLLVALVYKRYRMRAEDFEAIGKAGSFAVAIAAQHPGNYLVIDDSDLTDEQRDLIGGWISALYDTGGISDDLMKSIHGLIPIVPPIFQQSIAALTAAVVDADTVRSGLDYFLQPFLLPTLLVGFRFLCRYIAKCVALDEQANLAATLQILQHIVEAPLSDDTARVLRTTVMHVVGDELHHALADIDRARLQAAAPGGTEAAAIAERLAAATRQYHTAAPGTIGDEPGNVVQGLRDQTASLADWTQAVAGGHASGPPAYSPGLVPFGVRVLGATAVLRTLLDAAVGVLGAAQAPPVFDAILDTLTALVVVSGSPLLNARSRPALADASLLELVAAGGGPQYRQSQPAQRQVLQVLRTRTQAVVDKIQAGVAAAATMEEAAAAVAIADAPNPSDGAPQPGDPTDASQPAPDDFAAGTLDFGNGLDDSLVGADLGDLGSGLDLGSAFDLAEMEF